MPQDPAATLSALLRSASIQDHEEVLRAANAALKANKADVTAQHTRVVALLHLDRFDDALRAIGEGGDKLENACVLERVYALYKTGKLDDATAVLKSVGLEERSLSHVAAQVAYRAERFDEVHAIYQKLSSDDTADEKSDMNINSKAATAQAEWQGITPSQPPDDDDEQPDAFEVCFNIACSCIARGALEQASSLLQRAARLCDASDDLSEEDKEAEMAIDLYNSLAQSE
jgi:signal recognition particle subunit SRP72